MPNLRDYYTDPRDQNAYDTYSGDPRNQSIFDKIGSGFFREVKNLAVQSAILGITDLIFKNVLTPVAAKVFSKLPPIHMGGNSVESVLKSEGGFKNFVIGKIFSTSSADSRAYEIYKENWAEKAASAKKNQYGYKPASESPTPEAVRLYTKFHKEKIADFWKPENIGPRLTGKVMSMAGDYTGNIIKWYTAAKLTGIGDVHNKSDSSVKNFAQFAWYNIPQIAIMNNLKVIGGLVKESTRELAVNLGSYMDPRMMAPMLKRINNVMPKISAGMLATSNFIGVYKSFDPFQLLMHHKEAWNFAKDSFKRTYHNNVKEELSPFSEALTYLKQMNALHTENVTKNQRVMDVSGRKTQVHEWINEIYSKPLGNTIERILGLKRPAMNPQDLGFLFKDFKPDFKTSYEKVLQGALSHGVSLHDKGIYQVGEELVDLRNLRADKLFKRFVSFSDRHLLLGGIPLTRLWPGIEKWFAHKPTTKYLAPFEEYPIGAFDLKDSSPSNYHKVGQHGGLFMAKSFWEPMQNADGSFTIQRKHSEKMEFQLLATGARSATRVTMENYAQGHPNMYNRLLAVTKDTFIGKAIKLLDIEKMTAPGGIPGFFNGLFQKMFNPASPMNYELTAKEAVQGFQPMMDSMKNSILNIVEKSSVVARKAMRNNRYVMDMFGVDITMGPEELRKTLFNRVSSAVEAHNESDTAKALIRRYHANSYLNHLMDVTHEISMADFNRRVSMQDVISGRDQFLEYLAVDNMISSGNLKNTIKNTSGIVKIAQDKGYLKEYEASAVKIMMQRPHIEQMILESAKRSGNQIDSRLIDDLDELVKTNKSDYDTVRDHFFKGPSKVFTGFHEPGKNYDEVVAEKFFVDKDRSPYNGYVAVPSGNTKARFIKEPWMMGNEVKENNYISVGTGNILFEQAAKRFNTVFDFFGMGLDITKYQTGSDLLFKGLFLRRVAPVMALVGGYSVLNKAVETNPMFDGTALHQGIGSGLADVGVKARIMLGSVNDLLGVTQAARYAEGLMPGSVNSPLMRMIRGMILPIELGSTVMAALHGGNGYASGMGAIVGALGLGVTQGFGAFDLTKNRKELEDVYSGREDIPVRKGRWWILCELPGVKVITENGYMNIEDITPGLKVLDSIGNLSTVSDIASRLVNEICYEIIGKGNSLYPIKLTGEHPILIKRNKNISEIPAREVRIGDILLRKGLPLDESISELKLLPNYLPDSNYIYRTQVNWFNKKNQVSGKKIIRYQKLDRDLGLVFGHFLAEGSLNSRGRVRGIGGIEHVSHINELEFIQQISNIYKNKFGLDDCAIIKYRDNGCKIRLNCSILADVFYDLLYKDGDKYIPNWVFNAPREFISGFLYGLSYGDGCLRDDECKHFIFNQKRLQIIESYRELMFSFGIRSVLREKITYLNGIAFSGYELDINSFYAKKAFDLGLIGKYYDLQFLESKINLTCNTNTEFFEFVVGEIKMYNYEGLVYDICVPDDKHFTNVSGIVHNSSGDYMGGKVQYYRPNWYARLKSNYRSTPDSMGTPIEQLLFKPLPMLDFNPIGYLLDPHHYEFKHYYSQPFPVTATPFEEFPVVGPVIANTLGRLIQPVHTMHGSELEQAINGSVFTGSKMTSDGAYYASQGRFKQGTAELDYKTPVKPMDFTQSFDEQMYRTTEAAGLWGFGAQTVLSKTFGFETPFEGMKQMQSSSAMTSYRRQYWDMNLGDPMGLTEMWRRLVPRPRDINIFNPLMNTMPSWLPDKFHIGFAYGSVPEGELRLPGTGFEASHDVTMDYPVSADMLGFDVNSTVRIMQGLYPHNQFKFGSRDSDIDRINREAIATSVIYDPYHNINGMVDQTIRGGRQQGVMKIKELSDEELGSFSGPTNRDTSELNWLMRQSGSQYGVVQYQYQGQPIMVEPMKYSQRRYERDMEVITKARQVAARLEEQGIGWSGESYSHANRLKILANTAPYSNQYLIEKQIVKLQQQSGAPVQNALETAERQKKAIMMKQEFYPYRFLGKVMTPDSEYNNLSLNKNIKAASEYSLPERMIGASWEFFAHMQTPINSKFLNIVTPLEAYQRNVVYGRDVKIWDSPIDHFLKSYAHGFMSKTNPISGAIAGYTAGLALGAIGNIGNPGLAGISSIVGGGVGAMYGALNGIYRGVTNTTYVPSDIKEERKVNRYFDQLKFNKNMMLYEGTGDQQYLRQAQGTMIGLEPAQTGKSSWSKFYQATYPQEKPYIMAMANETDEKERRRIKAILPTETGEAIAVKWAQRDKIETMGEYSHVMTEKMPRPDWIGWSPMIDLKDIELKVAEQKGLEYHDFGIGFSNQMRKINNMPWLDNAVADMSNTTKMTPMYINQSSTELRRTLEVALRGASVDSNLIITQTPANYNSISVLIM